MKLIPLTKGYFAQVDDEDLEWLNQWKWNARVDRKTVYAVRCHKKEDGNFVTVGMHRQILGLTDPKTLGDHIDGNGLNNTRKNLRPCTNKENLMNRGPNINSLSRFKGVSWHKSSKRWQSTITILGKKKHLGYFDNECEAAIECNKAVKEHHKEFARYNEV